MTGLRLTAVVVCFLFIFFLSVLVVTQTMVVVHKQDKASSRYIKKMPHIKTTSGDMCLEAIIDEWPFASLSDKKLNVTDDEMRVVAELLKRYSPQESKNTHKEEKITNKNPKEERE